LSNNKKIFNDPIYGFITIPSELIFDIIEHPYFQRLRRIKQLGLADFTYPGALHTRFHHALGAMHLMGLALENLGNKGHSITNEEIEAAQIAILLHDIGHGPLSHALENTLFYQTDHEQITKQLLYELNEIFSNKLQLAIAIFENNYHRPFLHQLVSSQLDIDRLDYLQRDCYFTGVSEGTIGADRIIKMLELANDELVIEEKAIYSVENFLSARRLMYWQVYLHKTVVSAEQMIIQILTRAKHLVQSGEKVVTTPSLMLFLEHNISAQSLTQNIDYLKAFTQLDDYDIWSAVKLWQYHPDKVLSYLCEALLKRKLLKTHIQNEEFDNQFITQKKTALLASGNWKEADLPYLFVQSSISNAAYNSGNHQIKILTRKKTITDIALASDLPNIKALNQVVKKHFVCYANFEK
jgi:hypothetical protein